MTDCMQPRMTPTYRRRPDEERPTTRLHALQYREAIDELSISLFKQEYGSEPLQTEVGAYAAIGTVTKEGSYIAAADPFFIGGMIHCMQLWLLALFISRARPAEHAAGLPTMAVLFHRLQADSDL